jgi:DNA-binding SARP family transcriptional activator
MSWQCGVLGPLEAAVRGAPVDLGSPRQRVLLALLITQANEVMSVGSLIDALWPEDPPDTAANIIQGYVSELRKRLGREAIATRGRGYAAVLDDEDLDLRRFERLLLHGSRALERGDAAAAAEQLAEALALWRGPALADLDGSDAVRSITARLDELRMLAHERRIEADIACGRHRAVIPELEALVAKHAFRERLRAQLMIALYRSGRQADALAVYRAGRELLADRLGLEPGAALHDLQQAILAHDASLSEPELASGPPVGEPPVLLIPSSPERLDDLLALAALLVTAPPRELIVCLAVPGRHDLAPATELLLARRDALVQRGIGVRVAAFVSAAPADDIVRLCDDQEVGLLIVDCNDALLQSAPERDLLERARCDVAAVVAGDLAAGPVLVPFTGGSHDWAAVEIGAWLARGMGVALQIAGAATDGEGRDASRLLASASLAVQRAMGVPAVPVLVDPDPQALAAAARDSGVVVVGLSERWRTDGLGAARSAVAGIAQTVVLVRHGQRPSGVAPRHAATKFTWTLRR